MKDNDYAMLGCPACQSYILNGKQKFTCRVKALPCSQVTKCPLKCRVVDVFEYALESKNLEDIQSGIREVIRFLKEKN